MALFLNCLKGIKTKFDVKWFEVLTAVLLKIRVLCDGTLCRWFCCFRRFGRL